MWCLWREAARRPLNIGFWSSFGFVLLGALVIILSFTLDYRNVMAGGMPYPFHWGVFSLGLGIGAVTPDSTRSRPIRCAIKDRLQPPYAISSRY
jgi:hypothetical protein